MEDKIKKLEDLIQLFKSNSITKVEYELLKAELLNVNNGKAENNNSIKPKIERNVFEEIKTQNTNQIETSSPINKILLWLILIIGTVILALISTTSNSKNEETEVIVNENANSVNNTSETYTNTCSICGREFKGRGYEEVSNGNWQELEEPYQGLICTPACGRKHNQQLNDIGNKYDAGLNKSGTNSDNQGGYNTGDDGRIYEQNKCPLCKGTGIEKGNNVATGENEDRICPMCDGRGVRSY